jgi:hypothetical protein
MRETTIGEEFQQFLNNLRLRKLAETIESERASARQTSPSYTDLLARLPRAERLDKQEIRTLDATTATLLACAYVSRKGEANVE